MVSGRHPLGAALDSHVRLVLGELLPARHAVGAEELSLPTVKGWDWRFMNGGGYLTLLLVKSEEEKQQREVEFRKRIMPLIQDYDGVWQRFLDEILSRYETLKKTDPETASNAQLLENFEETIDTCRRMWEIHMYMMYGTYIAYILFENMCRELAGIDDTSPTSSTTLSPVSTTKCSRLTAACGSFRKRAASRGAMADAIFSTAIPSTSAGQAWRLTDKGQGFHERLRGNFMNEDGWRMQRMSEINLPTWVEDPTPALVNGKAVPAQGRFAFNLDEGTP